MSKIISSIFVSLDGFAADKNGDISWFKPTDEFFKYSSMLTKISDTAIYGRKTYEMMNAYWPTAAGLPEADWHEIEHSAWYNKSRKLVLSHTVKTDDNLTTILGENAAVELEKIKSESTENMLIFGSPSVVDFLTKAGLIDEYYIFVVPVVLGSGIRLFKEDKLAVWLNLIEVKTLEGGSVVLHYEKKLT